MSYAISDNISASQSNMSRRSNTIHNDNFHRAWWVFFSLLPAVCPLNISKQFERSISSQYRNLSTSLNDLSCHLPVSICYERYVVHAELVSRSWLITKYTLAAIWLLLLESVYPKRQALWRVCWNQSFKMSNFSWLSYTTPVLIWADERRYQQDVQVRSTVSLWGEVEDEISNALDHWAPDSPPASQPCGPLAHKSTIGPSQLRSKTISWIRKKGPSWECKRTVTCHIPSQSRRLFLHFTLVCASAEDVKLLRDDIL